MKNLIIFDLQGTLVKRMRPPILNGSISTLQKLAKNNTLTLFTGASRTETLSILEKLQIYSCFSPSNIVTKALFPQKPNPKAINWLIKKNRANSAVYIGDTRKDFQTAKNAQIVFIYIGKQKLGFTQISSIDQLLNVKIKL